MSDVSLERPLPHNLEAERAVLGAILLDGKAVYTAAELVAPEDFYLDGHRVVYSRILTLLEESRGIDQITLLEELRHHDELERAGGAAYVASLTDGLPRAINTRHHAQIVREKSSLRRLIQLSSETMARAYQAEDQVREILEDHEAGIFRLATRECNGSGFRPAADLVTEAYKEIETACNRKSAVTGLETGFYSLDSMTGGLQPEDLVIVAARPGLGKTSLALNIVCHAGIRSRKRVGVFSLEMSGRQLAKLRMIASEAEVDAHKLQTGYLGKDDWMRVGRAAGAISDARIYIDDTPGLNMLGLRARAQRLALEHGLDLLVIDYMQLMEGGSGGNGRRYENRTQEVTAISRGCKNLAKELHIPVIAISQLNRDSDRGGKPRRPQLSDLRESGAIEQDADLVLFIWREEMSNPTEGNEGIAEIIIGKQRNGATGSFQLAFVKQFTKFGNLFQESDQMRMGF